ncbi:MAG: hypothetical protein KBG25_07840 [Paludibacteraceae bacterium]|nr:hypothetical protein [Paludibacteraceae bacterium]
MLEEKNSIFLAYIKFTGIFLKADWYWLLDHFLQNLEGKIRYRQRIFPFALAAGLRLAVMKLLPWQVKYK